VCVWGGGVFSTEADFTSRNSANWTTTKLVGPEHSAFSRAGVEPRRVLRCEHNWKLAENCREPVFVVVVEVWINRATLLSLGTDNSKSRIVDGAWVDLLTNVSVTDTCKLVPLTVTIHKFKLMTTF
jgi:hypothetical protein